MFSKWLAIKELMEKHTLKNINNGKQSTVNKSLDGSTYPG
jgi:hypothetical protein